MLLHLFIYSMCLVYTEKSTSCVARFPSSFSFASFNKLYWCMLSWKLGFSCRPSLSVYVFPSTRTCYAGYITNLRFYWRAYIIYDTLHLSSVVEIFIIIEIFNETIIYTVNYNIQYFHHLLIFQPLAYFFLFFLLTHIGLQPTCKRKANFQNIH